MGLALWAKTPGRSTKTPRERVARTREKSGAKCVRLRGQPLRAGLWRAGSMLAASSGRGRGLLQSHPQRGHHGAQLVDDVAVHSHGGPIVEWGGTVGQDRDRTAGAERHQR